MKTINRRKLLKNVWGGIVACFASVGILRNGNAAEEKLTPGLLKRKLYAKTKSEEEFIDRVFQLRNANKISEKSLYAAYRYALKNRSRRFLLFKIAMTKFAKDEGTEL